MGVDEVRHTVKSLKAQRVSLDDSIRGIKKRAKKMEDMQTTRGLRVAHPHHKRACFSDQSPFAAAAIHQPNPHLQLDAFLSQGEGERERRKIK